MVPGVAEAFAEKDVQKLQELLERSQQEGGGLKSIDFQPFSAVAKANLVEKLMERGCFEAMSGSKTSCPRPVGCLRPLCASGPWVHRPSGLASVAVAMPW